MKDVAGEEEAAVGRGEQPSGQIRKLLAGGVLLLGEG